MNQDINQISYDFCEAACLNKTSHPWMVRKIDGKKYGWFELSGGEEKGYWYSPFIGVQFYAEIIEKKDYLTGEPYWHEVRVIRNFKNVYVNEGRTIPIEDVCLM